MVAAELLLDDHQGVREPVPIDKLTSGKADALGVPVGAAMQDRRRILLFQQSAEPLLERLLEVRGVLSDVHGKLIKGLRA